MIKHEQCYHCAGFYGPCFGEPLCATCHEFLCPADPFSRKQPLQLCDQKADECDSGNEEPRDSQQDCVAPPRIVRLDGDRVLYQYPDTSSNSPTSPSNFPTDPSDCFSSSNYSVDKYSVAYGAAGGATYSSTGPGPCPSLDYATCSTVNAASIPNNICDKSNAPLSSFSASGSNHGAPYSVALRVDPTSSNFVPKEESPRFPVHRGDDSVDSSSSDSDDENGKRLFFMVTSKVKALCSVPGAERYPKLKELERSFASILGKQFAENIPSLFMNELFIGDKAENDPMVAAQRRLVMEQVLADLNRSGEADYQDPIDKMINELKSCDPHSLCHKPNGKVRRITRKKHSRCLINKYSEEPEASASWQTSSNNNNNAYLNVSNNSCRCSSAQSSCELQERLCLLTNHLRFAESTPTPLINRIPPEANLLCSPPPLQVWLAVFRKMDDVSLWRASRVCRSWKELILRHWGHDKWRSFTLNRWRFFKPLYNPKHWHAIYTSLMEASPCQSCQSVMFRPVRATVLTEQRSWRMTRLRTELRNLLSDSPEGIEAIPLDIQALHWQASIRGPDESPYQGGTFFLHILIPPRYPLGPPVVRFLTKIFHPNVSCHGDIGIDSIQHNWSLALTISKVLISIQSLLTDPYTTVCMNPVAGRLYDSDRPKFDAVAREWTWRYAMVDVLQPAPSAAELDLCAAASDSFEDNSMEDLSCLLQDPGEDDNNDQEPDNNDQEQDNNEPDNNEQEQDNNDPEQVDPGQENMDQN
ncbi:hypothetical protein HAZT_HAZT003879 [Hyalella azteca]|uniref:E2 ubiquitin-conjugating enzyme n=1 Tax=Hyalella azteca TaxID=294128 RepID=A0A6A0H250_HYAAZ|nr:hypothetical protein HAZT_HAZT003879 [Hyalella azteca]